MKCYIITYDLCVPGRDYSSLYEAIKSYSRWGKITQSTWAIVTTFNAQEIRDHLLRYMDDNDRLMVIKGGASAAWRHAMASNEWLKTNLAL